jgi:hypothetical protein
MRQSITLTETNGGVVRGWCELRGAKAVMRGGPRGGSIGGTVRVTAPGCDPFILEPGDTVEDVPGVGLRPA